MASEDKKMWRVEADLIERVDRVAALVRTDPVLGKGGQLGEKFTRGDLLRVIVLRGLASLEGEIHGRKNRKAE